jgi:hypothetical protein
VAWATSFPVQSSSSIRGLLGTGGLSRWKAALKDYIAGNITTMDVCIIGDSNTYGYKSSETSGGVTRYIQDSWANKLKHMLQARFNGNSIRNGFGYMPFDPSGSSSWFPGTTTSGTVTGSSGDAIAGIFSIAAFNATARTNRYVQQMDGSVNDVGRFRRNVQSVELVYIRSGSGNANSNFDISTGSAPGTAPGGVHSSTFNCNGAANWHLRLAVTGLTRTANHYIQVGCGTTSGSTFWNGIIYYDDDYTQGIRVHQMGAPSRHLGNWATGGSGNVGIINNIREWCTNTGSGARYCKLFIIASGLNECGSGVSPTVTAANYQTYLSNIVADIRANCPSNPCVLIIGQFPWAFSLSGSAIYARGSDAPEAYRQAELAVARANPDIVEYLSWPMVMGHNGAITSATTDDYAVANGLLAFNDPVHMSTQFHEMGSAVLFGVLTEGVA